MLEDQLQQNNISGVWEGLKTMSGYKGPNQQPMGDQKWVNDLNLFFNRFVQPSTPPSTAPWVPTHLRSGFSLALQSLPPGMTWPCWFGPGWAVPWQGLVGQIGRASCRERVSSPV